MSMFFRLRTRLLLSSALLLLLLATVVAIISLRMLALKPSIAQLNQLNELKLQTRELNLRTQAASADLNAALVGVTTNLYQAQDFDRQMLGLGATLADMQAGAEGAFAPISEKITQVLQILTSYQQQGNALFSAVAKRQSDPTPENRTAVDQAIEPTSRQGNTFNQTINDLNGAVEATQSLAEQQLQEQVNHLITVLIGLALISGLLVTAIQLKTAQSVATPVTLLAAAARRLGQGDLHVRVPIKSQDEVGQLTETFNTMAEGLLQTRTELEGQNQRLESAVAARTALLQQSVAQLEQALAERSQLQTLLQGATTPVLPVAQGVLLMPLIGVLDDARAREAISHLLASVELQRCTMVILDITGLSVIDTTVAAILLQAAQAVRLLGAETIVCGVGPEVAETLVHLDVAIATIRPVSNLQAAVALALKSAAVS
jgi:anti-anti-sigma factor